MLGKQGYYPTDYIHVIEEPIAPLPQPVAASSAFTPSVAAKQNTPTPPVSTSSSNLDLFAGLTSTPSMTLTSNTIPAAAGPAKIRAKVLYDFAGTGANEMKLQAGSIIDVVTRGPPRGWSKGSAGAFPTDYVQFLEAEPVAAPVMVSLVPPAHTTTTSVTSTLPKTAIASHPISTSTVSTIAPQSKDISSFFDDLDVSKPLEPVVATTRSSEPSTIVAPAISAAATPFVATTSTTTSPFVATSTSSAGSSFIGKPAATVSAASTVARSPESDVQIAVAKYSRQASSATEISIEKGDFIQVMNSKDKDWWYGRIQGKPGNPGYFPSNYVELRDDSSSSASISASSSSAAAGSRLSQNFSALDNLATNATGSSSSASHAAASNLKPRPPPPERRSHTSSINSNANAAAFVSRATDSEVLVSLPDACRIVGLSGDRYACKQYMENAASPIWKFPFILDLFADPYKQELGTSLTSVSSMTRFRSTADALFECMRFIDKEKDTENISGVRNAIVEMSDCLRDFSDTCRQLPEKQEDTLRFYTFLVSFTGKVRSLRVHTSIILPLCWTGADELTHAILLVIRRVSDDADGYNVTVVNTSASTGSGIEYHPPSICNVYGTPLRRTVFDLKRVQMDRIQNTIFWYVDVAFIRKYKRMVWC